MEAGLRLRREKSARRPLLERFRHLVTSKRTRPCNALPATFSANDALWKRPPTRRAGRSNVRIQPVSAGQRWRNHRGATAVYPRWLLSPGFFAGEL